MRIEVKSEEHFKDVFDAETGESIQLKHTSIKQSMYYTIKKLNVKVAQMDIAEAQANICKSSKDIKVFWNIVDELDKYNESRTSATVMSKRLGVSRSKVSQILSASVKNDFLKKIDRGIYKANPFMIRSKGATNQTIEDSQAEWNHITIV